ncbi:MAG: DUF3592 domain-containing protein, partial [Thiobacillaceae bacterium]
MAPIPNYFKPFIDASPVLPIGLAIFLLFPMVYWVGDIFDASQAGKWPTVQGTVTFSRLGKGCGIQKSCCPEISYSYLVGGQSYLGYRTRVGVPDCGMDDVVKNMVTRYPVGKSVTVWFNPQHPDDSALLVDTVSENTWSNIYRTSIVV